MVTSPTSRSTNGKITRTSSSASGTEFTKALKKAASINWANDGKKINSAGKKTYDFLGVGAHYDIYLEGLGDKKFKAEVGRRANNGFPTSNYQSNVPASKKRFVIDTNYGVQFSGASANSGVTFSWDQLASYFALPIGLGKGGKVRLSQTDSESYAPTLYRVNDRQRDIISAGRGNDQLRIGKQGIKSYKNNNNEFYDSFDGRGGKDTVYLPGKKERYSLSIIANNAAGKTQFYKLNDLTNDTYMRIANVERFRFSGEAKNKGYVSFEEMLKSEPKQKTT